MSAPSETIEGELVEEKAIAVQHESSVGLLRDPDVVLAEAHKAAQALAKVLASKPRKIILNGKQYLEFEDWILLGQFYGVGIKTEWTRQIEVGDAKGWESAVVAIDKRTGIEVGRAEAMCLDNERNWKGKDSFTIRSMAQTRAGSKALSSGLRWIPVLAGYAGTPAEEMKQTSSSPEPAADSPAPSEYTVGSWARESLTALVKQASAEDRARVEKMIHDLGYTVRNVKGTFTLSDFFKRASSVQAFDILKVMGVDVPE